MSANFDWQTEEDDRREHSGWDEPAEEKPQTPRRRPSWRLPALNGGGVAAGGGGGGGGVSFNHSRRPAADLVERLAAAETDKKKKSRDE